MRFLTHALLAAVVMGLLAGCSAGGGDVHPKDPPKEGQPGYKAPDDSD